MTSQYDLGVAASAPAVAAQFAAVQTSIVALQAAIAGLPPGTSGTASPSLSATPNIFCIASYGAKGDGVTDDMPAILAAITAAGPTGGTVRLMPSVSLCVNPLLIPTTIAKIKIEGISKSTSGLNFPNGDGISFVTMYGTIELRDFSISCQGTAITLGSAATAPEQSTVERIIFNGPGTGLNIFNAGALHVQNNDFFNLACGIQLAAPLNPDGGDNWINNNFFLNVGSLSGTGAAIRHLSGGGYKIHGNKINGFALGIHECLNIGAGLGMSDVQIQCNNIEGFNIAGILFQNQSSPPSGSICNVSITGNQINGAPGGYAIEVQPHPSTWIIDMNISGNTTRGLNQAGGYYLDGVNTFVVSGNVLTDAGTGGQAIYIGSSSSGGLVTGNVSSNFTTKLTNNGAGGSVMANNNLMM